MPDASDGTFLVVGLGNPGPDYANTRHNVGFHVVDELKSKWGVAKESAKFHGLLLDSAVGERRVLLLKPQTYMNRSGLCVGEAVRFFKIPPETNLLVVSDDLDLPAGALRLRISGGSGGHNGLKSVIESLGTESFPRLRLGIGRAAHDPRSEGHILGPIPKSEMTAYLAMVEKAGEAVEAVILEGIHKAMNFYNQKAPGGTP